MGLLKRLLTRKLLLLLNVFKVCLKGTNVAETTGAAVFCVEHGFRKGNKSGFNQSQVNQIEITSINRMKSLVLIQSDLKPLQASARG